MASDTATVLRNVEGLLQRGTTLGLTDSQLLARLASRDGTGDDAAEAAFAALVDRHGGMVLRTCRRILGEDQAAQDVAQAAFLVLARRARFIPAGIRSPRGCTEWPSGWLRKNSEPTSAGGQGRPAVAS